jgi:hypothetical protein
MRVAFGICNGRGIALVQEAQWVEVRRIYDWALLPHSLHVDRAGPREEAQILAKDFRYHRVFRRPDACPPWVMGQELGWAIPSPVTIDFTPLGDVQLAAGEAEELSQAARLFGREEFWHRGDSFIATNRNEWLRSFQYRGRNGSWEGMFLPNGSGSVEWRLGFSLRIPDESYLLVTGLDNADGFTVPTGVLTSRQVNRTQEQGGFSMAFRPDRPVTVTRGQPIARIVLLNRDTLQARIREVSEQGDAGTPA